MRIPQAAHFLAMIFLLIGAPKLHADADQSSPKAAERSFWSAIDQADADGAKKLCKCTDAQGKWIDGFASMCDGFRKLHEAGTKRFGENPDKFPQHTPGYNAMLMIDKCTVKVDGDTATLTPPASMAPGKTIQGTSLVREDGKWIVDLKKSMTGDLTKGTAVSQAVGDSAREVAKNLDDGQYTSAAEADTDFKARLKKAMAPLVPAAPR